MYPVLTMRPGARGWPGLSWIALPGPLATTVALPALLFPFSWPLPHPLPRCLPRPCQRLSLPWRWASRWLGLWNVALLALLGSRHKQLVFLLAQLVFLLALLVVFRLAPTGAYFTFNVRET